MLRKTSLESIEAFVREQDAATLASVLLELAKGHAVVRDRLARLQLWEQTEGTDGNVSQDVDGVAALDAIPGLLAGA